MPLFEVTLRRKVTQEAAVVAEAETAAEARELAEDDPGACNFVTEWSTTEQPDNEEAISAKETKESVAGTCSLGAT